MEYIERKDYNKVITIKLVIPGGCNCKCPFCYMKDYDAVMANDFQEFHKHYLRSLVDLIEKICDKNPISLDITGNEPTLNLTQFITILRELDEADIKSKVQRVTLTTNGFNLMKDEVTVYSSYLKKNTTNKPDATIWSITGCSRSETTITIKRQGYFFLAYFIYGID